MTRKSKPAPGPVPSRYVAGWAAAFAVSAALLLLAPGDDNEAKPLFTFFGWVATTLAATSMAVLLQRFAYDRYGTPRTPRAGDSPAEHPAP